MEIRPILSSLLRNKTGALLIAAQVALSLAIVANALYIIHDRLERAARTSGVARSTGMTPSRGSTATPPTSTGSARHSAAAAMRSMSTIASTRSMRSAGKSGRSVCSPANRS